MIKDMIKELPAYLTKKEEQAGVSTKDAQVKVVTFQLQRPFYEPDNGATSWFAHIGLGTPAQPRLRFMIDTGTQNSWITSVLCTTNACVPHSKFNPGASSTYKAVGMSEVISFGDWGSMTITPSTDMINLPGISQPQNVRFDMATNYQGSQFRELISDGGIAIPCHMPTTPTSTEILNLLEQKGLINRAIASFWYDRATLKGQVQFGGIDFSKFDPATVNVVELIDFPSDLECWLVNLDSIDGLFPDGSKKNMLTNVAFALDTGSSKFKGDPKFIDACRKVITQNGKFPGTITSPQKISDYPYPTLELTINGVTYKLPPEKYFIQESENEWVLAFHFLDGCENEFLVGTTFLESLYTVFDFDNRCIIIADPIFSSTSHPSLNTANNDFSVRMD